MSMPRRLPKAARDPISLDPATPFDLMCSEKLKAYMSVASPQESPEEQSKRNRIMHDISTVFRDWVRSVCSEVKGLAPDVADRAGGLVLTSGSYRLGLNERGMDIDTICVAPQMVSREEATTKRREVMHEQIRWVSIRLA